VASWFSQGDFDTLFPHICESVCKACAMLTYDCMMSAIQSYDRYASFANSGVRDDDKRELAAWMGIMGQETTGGGCGTNTVQNADGTCSCGATWCDGTPNGCSRWGLCFAEEQSCTGGCPQYTSAGTISSPGKSYHGRGPKQLSWNYNYKAFSEYYCKDLTLLENPERVASNSKLAWASSIWFWFTGGPDGTKPGCHDVFTGSNGILEEASKGRKFGLGWAINIVNGGLECTQPKCDSRVVSRVRFYKYFCDVLGVEPLKDGWTDDDNLYCNKQTSYR